VVVAPAKSLPAAAPSTARPIPAAVATKSSIPPAAAKPANQIVTATGAVYKNTHVERVEPDGITISYTPAHGGIAIAKINFDELSDDLRAKYGFDPEKKRAYEKDSKQAAAWWRDQLIANDEAAKAAHQAQAKAEADADAQAKADRERQAATSQTPSR
jgi:hypothetical protein